jgi:hypothetical protein
MGAFTAIMTLACSFSAFIFQSYYFVQNKVDCGPSVVMIHSCF